LLKAGFSLPNTTNLPLTSGARMISLHSTTSKSASIHLSDLRQSTGFRILKASNHARTYDFTINKQYYKMVLAIR